MLAAKIKTETHLTTQPKPLPPDEYITQNIVLNKEMLVRQLERTVEEMFEGVEYTRCTHFEPFYPSTSSNYNYSRSGGGCVGTIYKEVIKDDFSFNGQESLITLDKLKCFVSDPESMLYGSKGKEQLSTFDFKTHEELMTSLTSDVTTFQEKWEELFSLIFRKAQDELPLVKALGLAEALKVRVISKGPPLLYTALKPLQKFLWRTLKNQTVFQLIGQPVNLSHIIGLFGEMDESEMIVNGDYKASTDNLHSWVSETLANKLVDVLNRNCTDKGMIITEVHREMLIRSLTGHIFEMEDGSHKYQREGQLMGSITSFPFLCLANAAMCRWALELSNNKTYRLRDKPIRGQYNIKIAPLIVNGDDCTMKGDRNSIKGLWTKITKFGGLESSIGKTLFSLPHRPVAVINSQTFDYNILTKEWNERKCVNIGLLFGKQRSTVGGGEDRKIPYEALGALHRELHRTCPEDIWPDVSKRFIYYNRETLSEFPNIPWDCPEYLGGPGLIPVQKEMSYKDRAVLSYIIRSQNSSIKSYKIEKCRTIAEWKLHKIVQAKLDKIGVQESYFRSIREDDGISRSEYNDCFPFESIYSYKTEPNVQSVEDNYSKLYKNLVVETLFTTPYKEVYVHSDVENDITSNYRTHWKNNRVHQHAYHNLWKYGLGGLVVRTTEDLMYEKKFLRIPVWDEQRLLVV
nr:RNA-dependent RNA polymerase [Flumine narna-like virus 6]